MAPASPAREPRLRLAVYAPSSLCCSMSAMRLLAACVCVVGFAPPQKHVRGPSHLRSTIQYPKHPLESVLSMGAPREDADKEGKECTVYDAIMHSEVVERAKTEKAMKEIVVELCLQWNEWPVPRGFRHQLV